MHKPDFDGQDYINCSNFKA